MIRKKRKNRLEYGNYDARNYVLFSEKDILKLTQQLSFATEKVETCEDILGEIRQNIEDKQEKKKKTHDLIKQLLEEEFSKRNSVGDIYKII